MNPNQLNVLRASLTVVLIVAGFLAAEMVTRVALFGFDALAHPLRYSPRPNTLTDLAASFERASFGIELGKLHLSLYDIGGAIGVLVIGVYLSRILQRWLANTVLPRTGLDTSLKNSIATIAGYIGVIAAISIALGRRG